MSGWKNVSNNQGQSMSPNSDRPKSNVKTLEPVEKANVKKLEPVVKSKPLGTLDAAPQKKKASDKPNYTVRETVKRAGGGSKWEDTTLLEWNPNHFRLFVGNLSGEVTDDMLHKAFERFGSLEKVKVVKDTKTHKNKGYGFVAFSNADDYFNAFKSMNGKYVGNHPVHLKRATTDVKRSNVKERAKPYSRQRR